MPFALGICFRSEKIWFFLIKIAFIILYFLDYYNLCRYNIYVLLYGGIIL